MSTTTSRTIAEHLARVTRPECVCEEGGHVAVAATQVKEVAEILRCSAELGVAVSARGGGTKQDWSTPTPAALALDMRGMRAIGEHAWQDMTCTVEAGCTWSELQATLAAHGQFVALDPLWPERSTVGGVIATNDSGTLRLKYGSLRDLVIGMTLVLPDGTIARSGGKVVKNVAGYDLHKLMIGAFGTLAVITEVTFRLHSIPLHTRSYSIGSADAASLGAMVMKILDSHLSTQSLQLRGAEGAFSLDIRLAGLAGVIDRQEQVLSSMVDVGHMTIGVAPADVWSVRQNLFAAADCITIKGTMLPSRIAQIADTVRHLGGTSVTQATGIMTAGIPIAAANEIPALRQDLEAHGGSLIVLRLPGSCEVDRWGLLPDGFPLMLELKQRFDPKRILNPKRLLGVI